MNEDNDFTKLFCNGTVEQIPIGKLAHWFRPDAKQLQLPPIQRSFVWTNDKILNYWDSLMRGYPAGTMLVTRRRLHGNREELSVDSSSEVFELFDGQQRLTSLLLGFDLPDQTRKIWIDIGESTGSGDRLFELRISSEGQPFGYDAASPNQKVAIEKRRLWLQSSDRSTVSPSALFTAMKAKFTDELSDATCPISLIHILRELNTTGRTAIRSQLHDALRTHVQDASATANIDGLLGSLDRALKARVTVQLVENDLLNGENYTRFFRRLGQGGTALSNDELTYSLLKERFPQIMLRVPAILKQCRLVAETDLVLGALRISQARKRWRDAPDWEVWRRPTPDKVGEVSQKGAETTIPYFLSLFENDKALEAALRNIDKALRYDPSDNPSGLPSMLLARLPRDLVDVLLLFTMHGDAARTWTGSDQGTLLAFVIYWLTFVYQDNKASNTVFSIISQEDWEFDSLSLGSIVHSLETAQFSRFAPRPTHWELLFVQVNGYSSRIVGEQDRFSGADDENRTGPSETLRLLSTNPELKRRVLLWVQRDYISKAFPHYDPTSLRDDDLPLDLDHVIPKDLFSGNWTTIAQRVRLSEANDLEQFRWSRYVVGDSLGNLRWLAAPHNRGRGKGPIEEEEAFDGLSVEDHIFRVPWNEVIAATYWDESRVKQFQSLIDNRTLQLVRLVMAGTGIDKLLTHADRAQTDVSIADEGPGITEL